MIDHWIDLNAFIPLIQNFKPSYLSGMLIHHRQQMSTPSPSSISTETSQDDEISRNNIMEKEMIASKALVGDFDPTVGSRMGLDVWRITRSANSDESSEIFTVPKSSHGKFLVNECYLVLLTHLVVEKSIFSYQLYVWVGKDAK